MKIKYPATHTVHWATGPTNMCERHAKQLIAVGAMFGTHTIATPCLEEVECENCENDPPKEEKEKEL